MCKYLNGVYSGFLQKVSACVVAFLLCFSFSFSQNISATATLDTNVIKIGEQTTLTLKVTHPKDLKIEWPVIPDTLSKIEFLSKSKIDTLSNTASEITRQQKISLTAWDSGYFVITPFVFSWHQPNDTTAFRTETPPLLLTTTIIPVDTTKAIKDIIAPINVGYTWRDWLPYVLGALVLIIIIWLVYYLNKKRKTDKVFFAPPKPVRPAHEIALEELEKLREEKLWQQGNYKSYHTKLTDILRIYIHNRHGIDAMEMTSDEILASGVMRRIASTDYELLKKILWLADMVKFAKAEPLSAENEQSLTGAFLFVQNTKQPEVNDIKLEVQNA